MGGETRLTTRNQVRARRPGLRGAVDEQRHIELDGPSRAARDEQGTRRDAEPGTVGAVLKLFDVDRKLVHQPLRGGQSVEPHRGD